MYVHYACVLIENSQSRMNITLILVSKMSSDVVDISDTTIKKTDALPIKEDLDLAIYAVYPSLEDEQFDIYFVYGNYKFIHVTDFLSYNAVIITAYKPKLFLLLNDCPEGWVDNLEYLLYLDRKEERERIEKARDKYYVKIVRPGDPVEQLDTSQIAISRFDPDKYRTAIEILMYAIERSKIDIRVSTHDVAKRARMTDLLCEGRSCASPIFIKHYLS